MQICWQYIKQYISLKESYEDYLYIGSAACNPNEWTTLSGSFTFTDTMTSALLYIESKATGDFYIDNVTVSTSDIIISDNTQNDSQINDDQNTKSDDESPDISENITEDKDTNINKAEIQNNAEDNSSAYPMKEVLSHTTFRFSPRARIIIRQEVSFLPS